MYLCQIIITIIGKWASPNCNRNVRCMSLFPCSLYQRLYVCVPGFANDFFVAFRMLTMMSLHLSSQCHCAPQHNWRIGRWGTHKCKTYCKWSGKPVYAENEDAVGYSSHQISEWIHAHEIHVSLTVHCSTIVHIQAPAPIHLFAGLIDCPVQIV